MTKKVLAYLAEGKSFYACTQEFNIITIQEVMEIYIASKNNND